MYQYYISSIATLFIQWNLGRPDHKYIVLRHYLTSHLIQVQDFVVSIWWMINPNQSAIYHDKHNEVTNNKVSPDYSPDQQKL